MNTEEIWKDIKDYEGLYQVSSKGRVKSFHKGQEKIIKSYSSEDKYILVHLYKNHKMKMFLVHRLVAIAFIPNTENLPEVNHRDEDKSNNCVENLEWCDRRYNINYGERNKKVSESQSKKIDQYTKTGDFVRTWNSIIEVERTLGIAHQHISKCCRGRLKSAGNFVWKYHK